MKLKVLANRLIVDGQAYEKAPAVVSVTDDNELLIAAFDGREPHSTVFVNGLTEITTDADGRAVTVTNAGRNLLAGNGLQKALKTTR